MGQINFVPDASAAPSGPPGGGANAPTPLPNTGAEPDPVKINFQPDTPAPATPPASLWSRLMSNSVPPATGSTDITGTLARLGGAANRETQIEAGNLAESEGKTAAARGDAPVGDYAGAGPGWLNSLETVVRNPKAAIQVAPAAAMATAGELIPQNRFAVGSALLGPALKAAGAAYSGASKIPSMLSKFMAPAAEAAPEASSVASDAMSAAPDVADQARMQGRWFSTNPKNIYITAAQDGSKTGYVDVPSNSLPAYRPDKIADMPEGWGNPDDPTEHVVPREVASGIQELSPNTTPPAPGSSRLYRSANPSEFTGSAIPAQPLSAPDPLTGGAEPLPPSPAPVAGATPIASAPPSKPGFVAQLIQGRAGRGMSLGEAQYAVDNPQVFDRAKSIPDAQAAYAESTPGLMGKGDSLAQSLNKTVVEPGDYNNAINKAGRLLNGTPIPADGVTELTPQIALDGVQSINQAMRNKQYTAALSPDDVRRTLATKDGLMDFLQNNGSPNMRAAAKDLFEAHVKDAFSDFLPQNKYGSTDAMRTMSGMQGLAGGVGAAAAGVGTSLATGSVAPAVAGLAYGGAQAGNALLSSPRVLQSIIQNAAAAPGAIKAGASVAAPVLANEAGGPDTSTLPPALARVLAAMPKQAAPVQPAVPPALARILAARRASGGQ